MYQGDGIDEGINDENFKTRQDKTKQALLFLYSSLVPLSCLSISISIYNHPTPNPQKSPSPSCFDRRRRGAGEAGLGWVGLGSIESTYLPTKEVRVVNCKL